MNNRITYSNSQQVALVTQVENVCPLCDHSLFYKKKSRTQKNYQLAHIYPLNPTAEEVELLKDEERLSEDVNDEDNIIPLCKDCHGKFDNPRTVEEYRELVALKRRLIEKSNQSEIWKEYNLEKEISEVITALYEVTDIEDMAEIEFEPKAVDEKLDETMSRLTRRKIKHNVTDFYLHVRDCFSAMDQREAELSVQIQSQVKAYYIKQKRMGLGQQAIFENIVSWLNRKTKSQSADATEILASYFVQNCEVF